ncbi:uncharacterized protein LOC128171532 [Crassostrea angulata]|uniref:uncharacterized protein LOC128171532 n=1 Tax=Magallana angulata TaxID=2784310 RepID=UPI0022B20C02|nr:uncharacterized protein LOC128171532 [Crassostrea angulata]
MLSKILWVLISAFLSLGICTQKRALPDPKAFNGMMAAMSLPTMQQENFQKMCLQSIPTQVLLQEIYSRMGREDSMSKSLPDPVDQDLDRASQEDNIMAQKRGGRHKISGFYSNW